MKFNLNIPLNVSTNLTSKEIEEVEYLIKNEDITEEVEEVTPEEVKQYLEKLLLFYLNNMKSVGIDSSLDGIIKDGLCLEYGANKGAFTTENFLKAMEVRTEEN